MLAEILVALSLPCTITVDVNGNASASCSGSQPAPTPSPTPAPTPAPTPVPPPTDCSMPSNAKAQPIYPGGTINYVYDSFGYTNTGKRPIPDPGTSSPAGSIQVFSIPAAYQDGVSIYHGQVMFGEQPGLNPSGALYEVTISRCPGDFQTYRHDPDFSQSGDFTYSSCGFTGGLNGQITWSRLPGAPGECYVPQGQQWYLNWRSPRCPAEAGVPTCGQTFFIPHD